MYRFSQHLVFFVFESKGLIEKKGDFWIYKSRSSTKFGLICK